MGISPQSGEALEYQLIRSKRRTMAIHITADAKVIVRAPMKLPERDIELFVRQKSGWIEVNLTEMKNRIQQQASRQVEGRLMLLGKQYPTQPGAYAAFDGVRFTVPEGDSAAASSAVEALYRKLAVDIIGRRVEYYSARMGLTPLHVKVNAAKGRWGSCSSKNGLNFSWRLIRAPLEAVDYVVVHELAHMVQHNHSAQFWQVVASELPDYNRRKAMLADNVC